MWFSFNFAKKLKDSHIVLGGSNKFKLSPSTCFGVRLQKNALPSFLLFWSICYLDGLSDNKRNQIASSTARNFNSS